MTKEMLAKLGIVIETDEIGDEEAQKLIEAKITSLNGDNKKLKDTLSSRNSEIAEYKRKDQEKMTEEEKVKAHYEELEKENASLKRKDSLNSKINDLMSIGYDKELATKYAEAELDGKSTIAFQKQFMEAKLETQKQELLKHSKQPDLGDPDGANTKFTKENFKKNNISMEEMNKLKEDNPSLYNELVNM